MCRVFFGTYMGKPGSSAGNVSRPRFGTSQHGGSCVALLSHPPGSASSCSCAGWLHTSKRLWWFHSTHRLPRLGQQADG